MSTVYYDKDWSEKPTYAEVVVFSSQPRLNLFIESKKSFDGSFDWCLVEEAVIRKSYGESCTYWSDTLGDLYDNYRYLYKCPDCIQDWFNHLYDLTLLLKED